MLSTEPLIFSEAAEWRSWLAANHDKAKEAWVVHYKVKSRLHGLRYNEALPEALTYGWIDGKLKGLDDDRFILRYTPRKPASVWSQRNKDIASDLIRQGKMAAKGLAAVESAKANGRWDNAYTDRAILGIPENLQKALESNATALRSFLSFPVSSRNMYIRWVAEARNDDTRRKRITQVVSRAQNNLKPGQAWKKVQPRTEEFT